MKLPNSIEQKPYPAYKSSGVEWLGEVPEHWEVRRLGGLGRFSTSGIDKNTVAGEPLVWMVNYLDVYGNSTRQLDASRAYQQVSCPEWKKQIHTVRCGDLIFTPSSETLEEIGISAVCLEDLEDTVYSYHVVRFRPFRIIDLNFKKFWCNCQAVRDQFSSRSKGTTRQILTRSDFRSTWVAVPPFPEQRAIARFLDHADQRIRRYIRAKERLIELLEEQKQAIIHQAVTGQIDARTGQPYPAYKDSGVEWLGEVPEHWEEKRLKYAVSFTGGGTPSKANASFWSGHVPWVSPKDMTRVRLDDTVDHISEDAVAASAASIVEPGTLLMVVRSGILRRTIPVAINTVPMALNQDMKALRPRRRTVRSDYLLLFIQGNQSCLLREWTKHGATVESIEHGYLANSRLTIPPLLEQCTIVRYLDRITAKIDRVITQNRRQIEFLQEYRTRLIADVVTGKLDVREAAVNLADEADTLEPLNVEKE